MTHFRCHSIRNSQRHIPSEWKICKIREVVSNKKNAIVDGPFGSQMKVSEFVNEGIPVIELLNIKNDKFYPQFRRFISEEKFKQLQRSMVEGGDIIISKTGTLGMIAMVPKYIKKAIITSRLAKISLDPLKIDLLYGYYALIFLRLHNYWENVGSGSTMKVLTINKIANAPIPLPPLPEQKKIAEILRTVDEAIDKVEEAIERTERLKKGLMQELLTKGIGHREFKDTDIGRMPKEWEVVRLGEIGRVVTGTTPSTKKMDYWIPPEVVWVTPADLSKVMFSVSDSERKVSKKALKECNLNILPEGSVIMSTRAPVGYIALVRTSLVFNQGCKGLILNEQRVRGEFLVYYLRTMVKKLQSLSGGSTFKELSKDSLEKVSLPLPPLHEQKQITEILMTVDNKLELLREKKKTLEQLKKGLMNDLLTGRRRVKVEPPKETLF